VLTSKIGFFSFLLSFLTFALQFASHRSFHNLHFQTVFTTHSTKKANMTSSPVIMMASSSPAQLTAAASLSSIRQLEDDGNMMSPSTAQIVASFNEQGIQFLGKSNYKEAYGAFSRGLSLVKASIACFDDDADQQDGDDDDEAMDTAVPTGAASICCFHQSPAPIKIVSKNKKFTEDQMTDDESFIFQHPMTVADTAAIHHQRDEDVSYTHYIELSFMLLYNLALCHHVSAMSSHSDTSSNDEKRVQKLRNALNLYELAYTISLTQEDTIQPTVMQQMVLVNNLGHVHQALHNAACSRQCFENLLSTLMFVKDCAGGEEYHDVEQMDGFLSNVMNLMSNSNCTCTTPTLAAAA
jgi:hypothetical protein